MKYAVITFKAYPCRATIIQENSTHHWRTVVNQIRDLNSEITVSSDRSANCTYLNVERCVCLHIQFIFHKNLLVIVKNQLKDISKQISQLNNTTCVSIHVWVGVLVHALNFT